MDTQHPRFEKKNIVPFDGGSDKRVLRLRAKFGCRVPLRRVEPCASLKSLPQTRVSRGSPWENTRCFSGKFVRPESLRGSYALSGGCRF